MDIGTELLTMGERLRWLRETAGKEQAEVAPIFGYEGPTGVSYLENGKRRVRGEHIEAAGVYYAVVYKEDPSEIKAFIHGDRVIRTVLAHKA